MSSGIEAACRALVECKGGEVVRVYRDNDRSAYSRKPRKDFEQMLTDARAGTITGVASWHPDRLSRDPDRDNIRIIDLHDQYGVQLATVSHIPSGPGRDRAPVGARPLARPRRPARHGHRRP